MYAIEKLPRDTFPPLLEELPDAPDTLFVAGTLPSPSRPHLCVVGARTPSTYGVDVCKKLIADLAGTDTVIVSGLARGIDACAHESALTAGLTTIAVPGSGLSPDVLYPRSNQKLARRIIDAGGALLSEYEPSFQATKWSFPKRNRIMAGVTQATLIIEAKQKSGTLITAGLALDYNRDVCAVPGSILSDYSQGTNELIRAGAAPITRAGDICEVLGIAKQPDTQKTLPTLSDDEQKIMAVLDEPLDRDTVIRKSGVATAHAHTLITEMELKGVIVSTGGLLRKA